MKKMTRFEAAAVVNQAFTAAGTAKAVRDPKSKGFVFSFNGESRTHEFAHGHHAHEQRKDEIAKLRLALVEELMTTPAPKAEEPAPAPTEPPKAQA